ncbi:MAG: NAD(P)H-hydrate dehydratase [Spirochaetales bacterium]|nr:NAD(P)H-hydrate dehydratase [Spirochaetales bacterium]
MRHLLSNSQALQLDAESRQLGLPSLSLMEQAGLLMYQALLELWHPSPQNMAVFLVGTGNNGGDGLVIARQALLENKFRVRCLLWGEASTSECQLQLHLVQTLGGECLSWDDPRAEAWLSGADLWVDALLGVGWKAPIRDTARERLARLEEFRKKYNPLVAAVDVPSGLNEDSKLFPAKLFPDGPVLTATWTLAAGFGKNSCFHPQQRRYTGQLVSVPVAFPAPLPPETVFWLDEGDLSTLGGTVPDDVWKNTRGHVAVAAGSLDYPGAGLLACRSAQSAGAGLVTLVNNHELAVPPSVMSRSEERFAELKCSAIVAGPGWGRDQQREVFLQKLWQAPWPMVVDADGLVALASLLRQKRLPARPKTIITPHPGELARLLEALNVSQGTPMSFLEAMELLAKTVGGVVVAKDSVTWIVSAEGKKAVWDGREPGLATGGTGDCLAGFMGAYLARGRSMWDAACSGVILQGTAGKALANSKGWFTADDLWEEAARFASCASRANSFRLK